MNVYIDESGIQFKDGHSVFAIVFVEQQHEQMLAQGVDKLTQQVRATSLHWSKMGKRVKAKVVPALSGLPFKYAIVIVPNPLKNTESALGASMSEILSRMNINALIIDGTWSKRQVSQFKRVLKNGGTKVEKLRGGNDKAYPGLILADIIAGLHRHNLDKPSQETTEQIKIITTKRQ